MRIRGTFLNLAWIVRLAFIGLVSTLVAVTTAFSHEIRPAVADVWIEDGTVRLVIDLSLESMLAGVDASAIFDTNDSPQAAEYDRLRAYPADTLRDELARRWPEMRALFKVLADGAEPLVVDLAASEIAPVGDLDQVRDAKITLLAELPHGTDDVQVGAAPSIGALILRRQGAGEGGFAAMLSPGELSPPLAVVGAAATRWTEVFVRYTTLGVEHIVPKGLDHIFFVLGLFFFSLHMRPLLMQVTAFTLAHTVTLALASLGWVSVPAAIVEPLIAASIVYVAVENLRGGTLGWTRTGVVFVFGLLHGLGFASVLGEIGLAPGQFLVSLIGFNIGVELGQLSVIAAAWLVVGYWFGNLWFYVPWIARPASIAIGLVGCFWLLERTIL
jgi:hypothetical protein